MSQNGNNGAIPFPQNRIPIVGQPFTIKNYVVMLQIQCGCPAKEPVLLMADSIGQCPGCKRQYQSRGFGMQNGQVQFNIAMMQPADQTGQAVGAGVQG